jgi:hypothetical protein
MPRKYKKMTGGFLDSLTTGASNLWNSTKKATTDAYNSATGTTTSTYTPSSITGGRTRRRKYRGGNYSANTPLTSVASHAAPVHGIPNAQPHNWVGGKSKRRRHRRKRSSRRKY